MTFLEFIEQQNKQNTVVESNINEAFKQSDLKKAGELIASVLTKHTGKKVVPMWLDECEKSGKEYIVQMFGVSDGDGFSMLISLDYEKDKDSAVPDSVSFMDKDTFKKYFWGTDTERVTVPLTVYTGGASVAFIVPIISRVIKSGDLTLTKEEAERAAASALKGKVKEGKADFFDKLGIVQYGNLKYNIFVEKKVDSSLRSDDDVTIYKGNEVAQTNIQLKNFSEMKNYSELQLAAKEAGRKMRAAQAVHDRENEPALRNEYMSMLKAIKGGATTLEEFNLYIKKQEKVTYKVNADKVDKKKLEEYEKKKKEVKDPSVAFTEMKGYLSMVCNGLQPGLIICGAPGVGKTYNVMKFLKSHGKDMDRGNLHIIKGKCTTRNLYLDLYNFKEKGDVILIDDADSLIGPKAPEDTINLLKAALDSNDDNGRLVSYRVGGRLTDDDGQEVPKSFKYKGSIIVLTNYNIGQIDTAIKGRVFTQDLNFTTKQLLSLVHSLMPALGENMINQRAKIKAYDYLSELADDGIGMEVSIRSFLTCAKLFQMGEENHDFTDDMIKSMIKDQVEHQAMRGGKKY